MRVDVNAVPAIELPNEGLDWEPLERSLILSAPPQLGRRLPRMGQPKTTSASARTEADRTSSYVTATC